MSRLSSLSQEWKTVNMMRNTEPQCSLASKLLKIGEDLGYIAKDGKNTFHKYGYTSHAAVVSEVYPKLKSNGVQVIETDYRIAKVSDDGKNVLVSLTLSLLDSDSGEKATYSAFGQGEDKGDKAVMKAMTAAHKYVWQAPFGLAWGDDPEADSETDKRNASPAEKKKPMKKKTAAKATSTGSELIPKVIKRLESLLDAAGVEALRTSIKTSPKGYTQEEISAAMVLCDSKLQELNK